MELPAPPDLVVPALPVQAPRIEGRFSVPIRADRDLTGEEIGQAVNRVLDFYDDASLALGMMRWHVGRLYAHRAPDVGWQEVMAHVNKQMGEEYGRSFLYESLAFYQTYGSEPRAEAKLRDMIDSGYYSWTRFRAEHGIGRRSEREQLTDGAASPGDHAAKQIESGIRDLQRAETSIEAGLAGLAEGDPLRETATEVLAQSGAYIADASRLLAEGARSAEDREPWRSEPFRALAKTFCCPWTGNTEVDFAHFGQNRGMAQKATDGFGGPMDHDLHMGLHLGDPACQAVLDAGPTEAEVALSVMLAFVTGRNDGPVRLVPNS